MGLNTAGKGYGARSTISTEVREADSRPFISRRSEGTAARVGVRTTETVAIESKNIGRAFQGNGKYRTIGIVLYSNQGILDSVKGTLGRILIDAWSSIFLKGDQNGTARVLPDCRALPEGPRRRLPHCRRGHGKQQNTTTEYFRENTFHRVVLFI